MSKKGLDTTFLHYGIRKEDMSIIESLCTAHDIDFTWIQENLLKIYHERKIKDQDIPEKDVEKMIEKALQKIK
jgi:hypothetical protein